MRVQCVAVVCFVLRHMKKGKKEADVRRRWSILLSNRLVCSYLKFVLCMCVSLSFIDIDFGVRLNESIFKMTVRVRSFSRNRYA